MCPAIVRISLPMHGFHCKCRPRNVTCQGVALIALHELNPLERACLLHVAFVEYFGEISPLIVEPAKRTTLTWGWPRSEFR